MLETGSLFSCGVIEFRVHESGPSAGKHDLDLSLRTNHPTESGRPSVQMIRAEVNFDARSRTLVKELKPICGMAIHNESMP